MAHSLTALNSYLNQIFKSLRNLTEFAYFLLLVSRSRKVKGLTSWSPAKVRRFAPQIETQEKKDEWFSGDLEVGACLCPC